jgi:hypothetical protein
LNLLISTINGNILAFSTKEKYHPLKSYNAQLNSVNGFAYRYDYHGIFVSEHTRKNRDIIGNLFLIEFSIVDKRIMPYHIPRKYRVKVVIGKGHVLLDKYYHLPGVYLEELNVPNERFSSHIHVYMENEKKQIYVDSFSVSFNMTFLRTMKFMIILPLLFSFSILLFLKDKKEINLPIN